MRKIKFIRNFFVQISAKREKNMEEKQKTIHLNGVFLLYAHKNKRRDVFIVSFGI